MPMEPFGERFADLAFQETRTLTAQALTGIPDISRSKIKDKANCCPDKPDSDGQNPRLDG